MTTTDSYGTWNQICVDYFPSSNLEIFPTLVNKNSLFRFIFSTNWERWKIPYSGYKSYGVVRFVFSNEQSSLLNISSDHKIYIREEPLLISFPTVVELLNSSTATRQLAIYRKFWKNSNWVENHPEMDIRWSVTIENLNGD
ncbi:hypothetical protein [Dapis sp. BLCC M172]|uniref:hypothetical protein n=1 Tax=Dapis sp. BLCC M172 TaxID=2975281 RepID=UPI003CF3B0A5